MASQIWRDCKLFMGAYDLSGDMSAHTLEVKADLPEGTVFGDAARRRVAGGLKTVTSKHEGIWKGGVDGVLFERVGAALVPVTICPQAGDEGELGFFFNATAATYSPGATVGELMRFSVDCEGSDGSDLVRGTVGLNGTKTSTGTGTVFTLGAVGATQKLYAALHVTSISGTATPTFTAKVQSAVTSFATITDQITFGAMTAIGSEMAVPVAGAITDTFWRVSWTISGTNPSFKAVVVIGIQ